MITSAVVFIVPPVHCCCLINQDEGALGDMVVVVVGVGRVTPEGVCEVAVVRWAVWRKRLFVNRVPPLCPREYMDTLMCTRRQTHSISRKEMHVCTLE